MICEYSVLEMGTREDICPICKWKLLRCRVDIPLYGKNQDAIDYRHPILRYCISCKKAYIPRAMFNGIINKAAERGLSVDKPPKVCTAQVAKQKPDNMKQKKKKLSFSSYYFSTVNSSRISPSLPPRPKTVEKPLEDIKFAVTNMPIESLNCPKCNRIMEREKYNIPVYTANGDFYCYYLRTLYFCSRCQKFLMKESVFNEVVSSIAGLKHHLYIIPTNMRRGSLIQRDDRYLYSPIYDEKIYVPVVHKPVRTVPYDDDSNDYYFNPTSFLKDMGYDTTRGKTVRRSILEKAVKRYGKRAVADKIRSFIWLREKQDRDYSHAISIWQDDLNYIDSLR